MNFKSRKRLAESIWKCLEWIIYLFCMSLAIYSSSGVIAKFFGQNTSIKQTVEQIESHPTITICPFLHSTYEVEGLKNK